MQDSGPSRQQRARRAHLLRERGHSWEQIADVWEADHPDISPRVAFRWAHNLSHQEVAERWNMLEAGEPTMTKARIYEFEAWPRKGRRPSTDSLEILARIYQTSARRLLTDDEYARYGTGARKLIDDIDYRHLDEAATARARAALAIADRSAATTSAVMLISRPKIVHPVDGKAMLLVDAGRFPMGPDDTPVELAAFYMDATLVTNDDYARFLQATGHRPPMDWNGGAYPAELRDHPVVNVTYHDASAYAAWALKRLPTAAEWEKAARGAHGYVYPWGDRPSVAKCNVRESGIGATTPVGRYQSGISPYGIYDLSGNVWEWCASQTTPGRRVLKGSAFTSPFEAAQATATNDAAESMLDDDTGFRCVCSPEGIDGTMSAQPGDPSP